jgi:broad specificity phosphatase PhoE
MPNKYILWVRHCEGCHNIARGLNFQRSARIPALCTHLGEEQSIAFGHEFMKTIQQLVEKLEPKTKVEIDTPQKENISLNLKENYFPQRVGGALVVRQDLDEVDALQDMLNKIGEKGVNLYSSTLPRAMETAKLISKGLLINEVLNKKTEIQRIDYIHEKIKKGEKIFSSTNSVNAATKDGSDGACCLLNKEFPDPDYANIDCETIMGEEGRRYSADTQFVSFKKDLVSRYGDFIKHILPKLEPDKLNIIISHSAFLKANLGFTNKMSNLDAYLVVYNKENEEIKDLRELYLFNKKEWAENVNNPPNRDVPDSKTIKETRNKDISDKYQLPASNLNKCSYPSSIFKCDTKIQEPNITETTGPLPTSEIPQKKSWWQWLTGKGGKKKTKKVKVKRENRKSKKLGHNKTKHRKLNKQKIKRLTRNKKYKKYKKY